MSGFFIGFFDLIYVIEMAFIYPIQEHQRYVYTPLILGLIAIYTWFSVVFSNPGFVKRPKQNDFLALMQLVDPKQLCPICEVVKTNRSRHCKVCNRCIDRMDHHCPWINNCVGVGNHKRFMSFLFFLMITLIYNFLFSLDAFLWVLA